MDHIGTGIERPHGNGPKLPPGLVVLHLVLKLLLLIGFVFLACLIARFLYFCVFGKLREPEQDNKPIYRGRGPESSRSGWAGGAGGGGSSAAVADSTAGGDSHRVVTMRCTIPEGMGPGQQLTWLSPSGTLVAMTIPQGSEAGQMLEFPVPAAVLRPRAPQKTQPPGAPPTPGAPPQPQSPQVAAQPAAGQPPAPPPRSNARGGDN